MKKDNRGGKRPNAGRKTVTGRTDRITISIRPEFKAKLKEIEESSDISPSETIDRLLRGFFEE